MSNLAKQIADVSARPDVIAWLRKFERTIAAMPDDLAIHAFRDTLAVVLILDGRPAYRARIGGVATHKLSVNGCKS